jgi:hypothetical protein
MRCGVGTENGFFADLRRLPLGGKADQFAGRFYLVLPTMPAMLGLESGRNLHISMVDGSKRAQKDYFELASTLTAGKRR